MSISSTNIVSQGFFEYSILHATPDVFQPGGLAVYRIHCFFFVISGLLEKGFGSWVGTHTKAFRIEMTFASVSIPNFPYGGFY